MRFEKVTRISCSSHTDAPGRVEKEATYVSEKRRFEVPEPIPLFRNLELENQINPSNKFVPHPGQKDELLR